MDVFVDVLLRGQLTGPPGSPVAFETHFGWVLVGNIDACTPTNQVASYHVLCAKGDDILHQFWEIEDRPFSAPSLTPEERFIVQHFKMHHHLTESERCVFPLPKREKAKQIGESRSLAVMRLLSLECTLHAGGGAI